MSKPATERLQNKIDSMVVVTPHISIRENSTATVDDIADEILTCREAFENGHSVDISGID